MMKRLCSLKKVGKAALCLYLCATLYSAYHLIHYSLAKSKWFKTGEAQSGLQLLATTDIAEWRPNKKVLKKSYKGPRIVEIWGKAAIADYLWEHILGGQVEARLGGVWSYGEIHSHNITFRYRTGPGVVPEKVPQDTQYAVLVLNGRSRTKVKFAQAWLDHVLINKHLQGLAVVMLGNERCENDWLWYYTMKHKAVLNRVFIVYDAPHVNNNNIIQWPLGVATYRKFPNVQTSEDLIYGVRKYQCNFLGTVYPNSSRELLLHVINSQHLNCFLHPRKEWWELETEESLQQYVSAVSQSDLTLCPVGQNAECYRIYEAIALGSVPVIETARTPGRCANQTLRILRQYRAPVIFVSDWSRLPELLKSEAKLTVEEIVQRREKLLEWYRLFKHKLKAVFVDVIENAFFT